MIFKPHLYIKNRYVRFCFSGSSLILGYAFTYFWFSCIGRVETLNAKTRRRNDAKRKTLAFL